jgi:hypothetical protein
MQKRVAPAAGDFDKAEALFRVKPPNRGLNLRTASLGSPFGWLERR